MSRSWLRPVQCIVSVAISAMFFLAIGCGGPQPNTLVTGKITFKDEGVSGTVTFTGPANVEKTAPIMDDGTYSIADVAVGMNQVTVKGMPGLAPVGGTGKAPKFDPNLAGGQEKKAGVAPPKKYETKDGGLSLDVKSGKQAKDFKLE